MRIQTIILLLTLASNSLAGTIYELTQYGQYGFWKNGSTVLSLGLDGTMYQDRVELTGTVLSGTHAHHYPAQFPLTATIIAPDLGTMYQQAMQLTDQPAIHGPDHGNTIMFDFTEIVGGGLEIGQDRMGMVYRYNGRVVVNFWMGSAVTSIPQQDLYNVGDAIFYADPVHTPEPGGLALFGLGLSGLAIWRRKERT